jgi:hypothetical protein
VNGAAGRKAGSRAAGLGARRCRDTGGVGLALVAAALLAALAPAAQAAARTDCTAGVTTVKGVTYRTFCGPAKAQATVHTVDYRFDNGGECTRAGSTWTINIGTITLGTGRPKYGYFGITVFNAHAGANANPAVAWQLPGKRFAVLGATVRLARGLKRGTFTGRLLGSNVTVTGGFTCSGSL